MLGDSSSAILCLLDVVLLLESVDAPCSCHPLIRRGLRDRRDDPPIIGNWETPSGGFRTALTAPCGAH
jgi:hypothetical protein